MPLPTRPPSHDDPHTRWCTFTGPGDELPEEPKPVDEATTTLETLQQAEAAAEQVAKAAETIVSACPPPSLHAVEVDVLDDEDRPLVGQVVELRRSDTEAMATKTDAGGHARFEGLDPGSYTLGLPLVDEDGWELLGNEALPAERDSSSTQANWKSPTPASTQTLEHTIEAGQCLSTLAYRHGWVADALWEQNPDLSAKRDSKNVLAAGDVVVIPPVRAKFESVQASKIYRLRRTAAVEQLEIRFLGDKDAPRKGEPYILTIISDDGEEVRNNETNGKGVIRETLPSSTREVRIELGPKDQREHHIFRAAHLEPIDTPAGIQSRLFNLDFEVDEQRGELGPITTRAIAEFQREQGLDATGEADQATRDALVKLYLI
ncbi:MAG: peptidoglycan-binding protein [Deltaproteobacteria bacterium]|nr:peptidoglycan-binding protein [Deltaproteobacteria bacterium]